MPLSSAAREKLRRETMSQKIFRDLRFMGTRETAAQNAKPTAIPDEKNK